MQYIFCFFIDKSLNLGSKIQGNWSLFANLESGQKILNYVSDKINSSIHSSDELVDFNDDIHENINYWFKLKEQLKWERRYLTNIGYLTDDLGWDSFFESKITIKNDNIFYRARLHKNADEDSFTKGNMFWPKKNTLRQVVQTPMEYYTCI